MPAKLRVRRDVGNAANIDANSSLCASSDCSSACPLRKRLPLPFRDKSRCRILAKPGP